MTENLKYLPAVSADNGSFFEPNFYVYDYDGTDVNAAKAKSNYQNYGVLYIWPWWKSHHCFGCAAIG